MREMDMITNTNEKEKRQLLPAIAMRGLIVFPQLTLTIDVERLGSVHAVVSHLHL